MLVIDHGGEQRDRGRSADEGDRRDLPRAQGLLPHRRGAGGGQDPARRGRDEDRPAPAPATSSTGRRASARSTCGAEAAGAAGGDDQTAAGRSAGCAPAPCRRRCAWAWARPAGSPKPRWARRPSGCMRCATGSTTASWRSCPRSTSTATRSSGIPGNLNLSFAYVEGEGLMMGIKDLAVSSGSACTSASLEPSYVLRALGVDDELAHTAAHRHRPVHHRGRGRLRRQTGSWRGDPAAGDEPAVRTGQEGVDLKLHPVGGALDRDLEEQGTERRQWLQHQDHRPLREPAQRRVARQGDQRRHRSGRGAGLRRRDEAADQGEPGGHHRGRQVQDLRLRLGDRLAARWSPSGSRARRIDEARDIKNTADRASSWRCRR